MDVNTVILIYGVLAVAGILILAWFGLMFVASRFSDGIADSFDDARERLGPYAVTAAFVVAALATIGSLYFSEVAHFRPCLLCWYQRIAMYPLALILLIAAIRRDLSVRWYAIPLALVGGAISIYHYFLEWFPDISTGACEVDNPCTAIWFREFGFISLPFLALVAFALVITFLLVPLRHSDSGEVAAEPVEVEPDAQHRASSHGD
jgi:disulfide bond formation protein DsbB